MLKANLLSFAVRGTWRGQHQAHSVVVRPLAGGWGRGAGICSAGHRESCSTLPRIRAGRPVVLARVLPTDAPTRIGRACD